MYVLPLSLSYHNWLIFGFDGAEPVDVIVETE